MNEPTGRNTIKIGRIRGAKTAIQIGPTVRGFDITVGEMEDVGRGLVVEDAARPEADIPKPPKGGVEWP